MPESTNWEERVEQQGEYDENYERTIIAEYSRRLFNWYCLNSSFFSGDITVMGNPDYRIGNRLLYKDINNGVYWEYYIESVEHNFSHQDGYTTKLGVTRGLKVENEEDDGNRFNPPMSGPDQFKGGYLGEASLQTMLDYSEAQASSAGLTGQGGIPQSDAGNKVAEYAISIAKLPPEQTAYHWGGGHANNTNPLKGASPYLLDCSGFVYWAYDYVGYPLGDYPMTTNTFQTSNKLTTLATIGSGFSPNNLQAGDLVFFNGDSHVGIATGDGDFVGFNGTGYNNFAKGAEKRSLSTGYWRNAFEGHVMRYKG